MSDKQNCAVIGAGVVGICCAIALLERGYGVTLYDPQPPGSMTSKGNAGGFGFTDVMPMAAPGMIYKVPKWLLDPCGPLFIKPAHFLSLLPWLWHFQKSSTVSGVEKYSKLLSSILQSSMTDTRELISRTATGHLFTEKGALTVYKSKKTLQSDDLEWRIKRQRGVKVEQVDANTIREMEPQLQNANFGYYTPEWCNTVDPYLLTRSFADYFCAQGGKIQSNKVSLIDIGQQRARAVVLDGGQKDSVDHVVVAAGVWSKQFCEQLAEKVLMESERGYNTTLPNPGVRLNHQIIFAEEKFVITHIGNGLRIGGAAEFAGINSAANYKRSERLLQLARRYLPGLEAKGGEQWMGQRPSTPDSIPVIGPSARVKNVHYAFGHGHYGLTMAATTGKLIADSVSNTLDNNSIDLQSFSIERFS